MELETKDYYFQKFLTLEKKKTRFFLHGSTLSEYLRSKQIPRGLRIQKEPTLGYNDQDFCTKQCEILNKASLDLMVVVIKFVQKELDDINKEISSTEQPLDSVTTDLDFESLKTSLDSTITKYCQEICKIKLKKLDTLDYRDAWLYNFQHP